MTIRQTGNATASSQASTAWQCSFKFSNHDEALKAGLNVDAIVYGVPLKVGGTFDKATVDKWREENCSKSSQSASFEGATYSYLREVAPGSMAAFASCVESFQDKSALACTLTREPGMLNLKWRRLAGEKDNAAPVLQRLMVVNGSCNPGVPAGKVIFEGGVGSPCTAEASKDLLVMAETSRGICSVIAAYPKRVFSVAGVLTLDGDRTISSDIIEFSTNSRIVTNGNALTLNAPELRIKSQAAISSFISRLPSGPAGTPGDDGGTLVIKTEKITGGDLRIDLSGQDGVPGADGAPGGTGAPGSNARGRGLQGLRGCGGGNDASAGAPGGPGGDGTTGGAAGNGGVIVVQVTGEAAQDSLSRLLIVSRDGKTLPGSPGRGGSPGPGGQGGPGGAGDGGHDGCGGRPGASGGPPGPSGRPGDTGSVGRPGSISLN